MIFKQRNGSREERSDKGGAGKRRKRRDKLCKLNIKLKIAKKLNNKECCGEANK
jgi:hypothetical protein